MAYAKKTCNLCGWRDIQPRMVKKHKTVQVAQGKRGLSKREVAFALMGSKTAQRSVTRWATAPNKRVYSTKRLVWMCEDCSGSKSDYTIKLENEAREKARAEELAIEEAARKKRLEQFRKEKIKANERKDILTTKLNTLRIEKGKIEKALLKLQSPLLDKYFNSISERYENSAARIHEEMGISEFLMMARHVAEDPTVSKNYQIRIKKIIDRLGNSNKIIEQLKLASTPTFDPENPLVLNQPILEEKRGAIRFPGDIFKDASNSLFIRLNRILAYIMVFMPLSAFLLALWDNLSGAEWDGEVALAMVFILLIVYPNFLLIRYLYSFNVRRQIETRKHYKKIFNRIKHEGIKLFKDQAFNTEANAGKTLSGSMSEINKLVSQFKEKKCGIKNVIMEISSVDEEVRKIAKKIKNNS